MFCAGGTVSCDNITGLKGEPNMIKLIDIDIYKHCMTFITNKCNPIHKIRDPTSFVLKQNCLIKVSSESLKQLLHKSYRGQEFIEKCF